MKKQTTFFIKTYGCQMNERDSDSAAALLMEHGFLPASDEYTADVVILNTCSVRDQAERKAIGKLGIMKRSKAERPHMIFGLMGCMAQSRGDELLKKIPHLDFVIGTDQIHSIPDAVQSVLDGSARKLDLRERSGADTPGIDKHRLDQSPAPYQAFISIMRGCDRYCSYCIVPYVRGHERSRSAEGIIAEAKELVSCGVKEIMLLGQNVAAFGLDQHAPHLPEDLSPFADLLTELAKIEGLERIRFTSPHPAYFNRKLIETIAREKKICKAIHLPLQSGSDPVLKRMNRPYNAAQYKKIVDDLKALVPEITFSTDVIVGFPGETDADFELTRQMMNSVAFDNAFIFKYSPRKGTVSAKMEDDVPQSVKEERNQSLLKDLEERQCVKNAACVGTEQILMLEGPSKRNPARWSGRTDTFKLAVFEPLDPDAVKPGDLVRVRIVRSTPMTLYGEQIPADC